MQIQLCSRNTQQTKDSKKHVITSRCTYKKLIYIDQSESIASNRPYKHFKYCRVCVCVCERARVLYCAVNLCLHKLYSMRNNNSKNSVRFRTVCEQAAAAADMGRQTSIHEWICVV